MKQKTVFINKISLVLAALCFFVFGTSRVIQHDSLKQEALKWKPKIQKRLLFLKKLSNKKFKNKKISKTQKTEILKTFENLLNFIEIDYKNNIW